MLDDINAYTFTAHSRTFSHTRTHTQAEAQRRQLQILPAPEILLFTAFQPVGGQIADSIYNDGVRMRIGRTKKRMRASGQAKKRQMEKKSEKTGKETQREKKKDTGRPR